MSLSQQFLWAEYQRDCGAEIDYRHLSTRRAVARKGYLCAHCKGPIEVGKPYDRVAYLSEGQFYCERVHSANAHCLSWET